MTKLTEALSKLTSTPASRLHASFFLSLSHFDSVAVVTISATRRVVTQDNRHLRFPTSTVCLRHAVVITSEHRKLSRADSGFATQSSMQKIVCDNNAAIIPV